MSLRVTVRFTSGCQACQHADAQAADCVHAHALIADMCLRPRVCCVTLVGSNAALSWHGVAVLCNYHCSYTSCFASDAVLAAGWGYTHVDALGTPRTKGRHRPAKPRKGRALKGNKRAKGKSGKGGWDDDEDATGNEVPLVDPYGRVLGAPLPVVEGIYAWKWPSTSQELDR